MRSKRIVAALALAGGWMACGGPEPQPDMARVPVKVPIEEGLAGESKEPPPEASSTAIASGVIAPPRAVGSDEPAGDCPPPAALPRTAPPMPPAVNACAAGLRLSETTIGVSTEWVDRGCKDGTGRWTGAADRLYQGVRRWQYLYVDGGVCLATVFDEQGTRVMAMRSFGAARAEVETTYYRADGSLDPSGSWGP